MLFLVFILRYLMFILMRLTVLSRCNIKRNKNFCALFYKLVYYGYINEMIQHQCHELRIIIAIMSGSLMCNYLKIF